MGYEARARAARRTADAVRLCVCTAGRLRARHEDHVPSKTLFPKPRPRLVTVPCCEPCRCGQSEDDERHCARCRPCASKRRRPQTISTSMRHRAAGDLRLVRAGRSQSQARPLSAAPPKVAKCCVFGARHVGPPPGAAAPSDDHTCHADSLYCPSQPRLCTGPTRTGS
jgi:hypothetical protein